MSDQTQCLFVGGPWDGRRIALSYEPDLYFVVALRDPMPTFVDYDADPAETALKLFRYRALWRSVPYVRELTIFVPDSWWTDPTSSAEEKLVRALTRGYVGRL